MEIDQIQPNEFRPTQSEAIQQAQNGSITDSDCSPVGLAAQRNAGGLV